MSFFRVSGFYTGNSSLKDYYPVTIVKEEADREYRNGVLT
jgi:hypothetical protein